MFGERLKKLRKRMRLSQKDFGEKIGVTRQTIAYWETDERVPDIYMAKRIAKVLDISLDELVEEEKQEKCQVASDFVDTYCYYGTVKVQAKGEVRIPQEARERFSIRTGDELFVVGDVERGLELLPIDVLRKKPPIS